MLLDSFLTLRNGCFKITTARRATAFGAHEEYGQKFGVVILVPLLLGVHSFVIRHLPVVIRVVARRERVPHTCQCRILFGRTRHEGKEHCQEEYVGQFLH